MVSWSLCGVSTTLRLASEGNLARAIRAAGGPRRRFVYRCFGKVPRRPTCPHRRSCRCWRCVRRSYSNDVDGSCHRKPPGEEDCQESRPRAAKVHRFNLLLPPIDSFNVTHFRSAGSARAPGRRLAAGWRPRLPCARWLDGLLILSRGLGGAHGERVRCWSSDCSGGRSDKALYFPLVLLRQVFQRLSACNRMGRKSHFSAIWRGIRRLGGRDGLQAVVALMMTGPPGRNPLFHPGPRPPVRRCRWR